jgi:hypothetical protein
MPNPSPALAPPAEVNNAEIAATLERLRADGSYQFDFTAAPPPPQPPEWLRDILAAIGNFFSAFGPLFQFLFWAAVAALVLFLLYLLVPAFRDWIDNLRGRRALAVDADEHAEWRPDSAAARDLLAEADALAAAGRYGDAVRLLLGRSIEDIDRRRPGLLRPALTARGIARDAGLPDGARGAFGALAMAVERAHYALRDLSSDEWQSARSAYADFALPTVWKGAAA